MVTRKPRAKTKGRGAPGKAKSKAHREALSRSLRAYHASKKGKGKRKSTNKTSGVKSRRTVGKAPRGKILNRDTGRYIKRPSNGPKRARKKNYTSEGRTANEKLMSRAKKEFNKRRAMGLA